MFGGRLDLPKQHTRMQTAQASPGTPADCDTSALTDQANC